MVPPALPETAFVAVEAERLIEALCIEEERTVGRDNTVAWEGRRLQIPESPLRRHYVGATVKVHAYPDGTLGILHGPKPIARFTAKGAALEPAGQKKVGVPAVASVASRSAPSRRGLETPATEARAERRPALTGPRRDAKDHPSRNRVEGSSRSPPLTPPGILIVHGGFQSFVALRNGPRG